MHSFILPFNIYSVLNLDRLWAHKIRHYLEYRHSVLIKYCHRTEHPSWVGVVKEPKKLSQRSIIQKLWIAMLSPFYVAFCCENNFPDRILLSISAGSFPAVRNKERYKLQDLRKYVECFFLCFSGYILHSPLSCSVPQKADQWELPLTLSCTLTSKSNQKILVMRKHWQEICKRKEN